MSLIQREFALAANAQIRVSMKCLQSIAAAGQWSVVGGQWSVVGGRWSVVVGGRWSVVGETADRVTSCCRQCDDE